VQFQQADCYVETPQQRWCSAQLDKPKERAAPGKREKGQLLGQKKFDLPDELVREPKAEGRARCATRLKR
jgi:hypothetical protein